PLPLAAGCTVWIDLAAPVVLAPVVVDAAGAWTLTVPVPFDPTLAGVALVLQAYVAPAAGPLGLDLTGGFAVVFGY
ncbi:MAG TPA: hypothetical protein VEI02_09230, partial [Planctomycetota bacterium]|nr:hypothetical protein [Planctomycetota bacterium]